MWRPSSRPDWLASLGSLKRFFPADVGKEGRSAHACREAAARLALVASERRRLLCVSGRVFIQEASPDETATFLSQREVKPGELKAVVDRMNELSRKTLPVIYPSHFDEHGKPKSSSEILPLQPLEEGS
jgi:hypothetical protein